MATWALLRSVADYYVCQARRAVTDPFSFSLSRSLTATEECPRNVTDYLVCRKVGRTPSIGQEVWRRISKLCQEVWRNAKFLQRKDGPLQRVKKCDSDSKHVKKCDCTEQALNHMRRRKVWRRGKRLNLLESKFSSCDAVTLPRRILRNTSYSWRCSSLRNGVGLRFWWWMRLLFAFKYTRLRWKRKHNFPDHEVFLSLAALARRSVVS